MTALGAGALFGKHDPLFVRAPTARATGSTDSHKTPRRAGSQGERRNG